MAREKRVHISSLEGIPNVVRWRIAFVLRISVEFFLVRQYLNLNASKVNLKHKCQKHM